MKLIYKINLNLRILLSVWATREEINDLANKAKGRVVMMMIMKL